MLVVESQTFALNAWQGEITISQEANLGTLGVREEPPVPTTALLRKGHLRCSGFPSEFINLPGGSPDARPACLLFSLCAFLFFPWALVSGISWHFCASGAEAVLGAERLQSLWAVTLRSVHRVVSIASHCGLAGPSETCFLRKLVSFLSTYFNWSGVLSRCPEVSGC